MRKSTTLPHRNRAKSARARAKRRAKFRRRRLQQTGGERRTYR